MKTRLGWVAVVAIGLAYPTPRATAHPGGLNGEGCHNNRRTGEYHCHRGTPKVSNGGAKRANGVHGLMGIVGRDAYYPNCAAARAAGAAPIRAGAPGYRPKLDRDGDGVACE